MKPEDYEKIIRDLRADKRFLEDKNKDLIMKLSAIKVILHQVNPVCSEKLKDMIEACEGCSSEKENE